MKKNNDIRHGRHCVFLMHVHYGVECWSARDLQTCLGYSLWRDFKNAIKKAIGSCEQSGNASQNHFADARKKVGISEAKQIERLRIITFHALLVILSPKTAIQENPKLLRHKSILRSRRVVRRFQIKWLPILKPRFITTFQSNRIFDKVGLNTSK